MIAVSNHEFYGDNLFIVPSPLGSDPGLGLKFRKVDGGTFDRGRSMCNRTEARAVAQAVMEHAARCPDESLGVAAFSVSQRDAILNELELLRRAHPETEGFFHGHEFEPFFVKNLENVQGDERDVIFISVGYAPDGNGFFGMNFGPINRDGGERRLNVLISRAKNRCEVFTSIEAGQIDLTRSNARGVVALKNFLQYAKTGILGTPEENTDRGVESPFEASVKKALEGRGVAVRTQVGTAGFFIDLAVVDPAEPGRYLLGIECDGATYHSARSARERDRQRQAVLEAHGWTIHRIWSCDWFHRPQEQLGKVLAAIEQARQQHGRARNEVRSDEAPLPPVARDEPAAPNEGGNLVSVPYEEAVVKVDRQTDLHAVDVRDLARLVLEILKVEAPVHQQEVITRICRLCGVGRAGRRIQDAIENAIRTLVQAGTVHQRVGFLSLPDTRLRIRDRSGVNSASIKNPEYLPPEEIDHAILTLAARNHGMGREEALKVVARAMGFQALGENLRPTIGARVDLMLEDGRLKSERGFLRPPQ